MRSKLAIIGAGDLGRQIAHYIVQDTAMEIVGFFDDTKVAGSQVDGIAVLGAVDAVADAFSSGKFEALILAIGYHHLDVKRALFKKFNHIPFASFVHASAWVDPSAEIHAGVVIFPGCVIDKNAVVNANVLVNIHCTISHDSVIGAHSFLSPRVAIAGFCKIGEQCTLGINSTIIDSLTVASDTQVGAGAVVTKDILQKGLYVGVPAKQIK